jgi:hypothetical protein
LPRAELRAALETAIDMNLRLAAPTPEGITRTYRDHLERHADRGRQSALGRRASDERAAQSHNGRSGSA